MKKVSGYINQEEIKSYLKDLRKIKVMTSERESELKKIMLSGNVSPQQKEEIKKERLVIYEPQIALQPNYIYRLHSCLIFVNEQVLNAKVRSLITV